MTGSIMSERLTKIVNSGSKILHDFEKNLSIFSSVESEKDLPRPNLGNLEGQKMIDDLITTNTKLIIVDNLSCLVSTNLDENNDRSWNEVSNWALQKRKSGISVIFVHHAGKGGVQRGTSRREDILDTSILLKHPKDYEPSQGARFEVHFEKSRHFYGDEVKPFTASLEQNNHKQEWVIQNIIESNRMKAVELHNEGLSNIEIASELSISRQAIYKHLRKAEEQGEIKPLIKRNKCE
jgi:predicted DNA-binding protein YlxM (UPF0122 family)